MAQSAKSLIEVCIEEYEKQIPLPGGKKDEQGSLNDEQKKLLESCVNGSVEPETAAAGLPRFAPWPQNSITSREKLERWVDDNNGKNEIPKILRFLALAQATGGSEFVSGEIHKFFKRSHWGYKRDDFFGDGGLSPVVELNFFFYEHYDIHGYEMRPDIDGVYEKNPALFTEIAGMEGHPFASLRAAVYLNCKGDASMEKRIGDLISSVQEVDDEFSFTVCAENGFVHPALRENLKERFIKSPASLTNHICRGEPAKMDYALKLCRDLGISDTITIQGFIDKFCVFHKLKLAAFLKPFSSKEFEESISYLYRQGGGYIIINVMLALVTVCDSRPKEDWKLLVNILADRFDDLIRQQIIGGAKDEGDKKTLEHYFFNNDDGALNRIAGEIPNLSAVGELFGYFADEEPLKEKIRRYAIFLTLPSQLPAVCHFSRSLWRKYHWDTDTMVNYFLDSAVAVKYKVIFIDEMNIPSSVRDPKREPVLLDEVSEAMRKGGQKFLLANKNETHAFIEGGVEFWDLGILACYYYGHSKEADPRPVLAIMGTKQKPVKKRILEVLAGYPEIRPDVEKLAESKNKQIRTNAEAVLAQWNELEAVGVLKGAAGSAGAGGAIGADFDIIAYAAKSMPSGAKKLLSFTDPASWPKVSFAKSSAGYVF